MKVLVIGGSKGIGKELVQHFNGKSVSRQTGHNIQHPANRNTICQLSLDFDVVVNHAFCGDNSQNFMLKDLVDNWNHNNKDGYIFHTGTISTYFTKHDWNMYAVYKAQGDEIAKRAAKKCQHGAYPFRLTNIRPGMLDTEKSRNKQHWPGSGVKNTTYVNIIEYLYNLPSDVIIPELILETRVPT
jgi:NAD(P)-dependent dehydrogenase (short-subunit alcohol dehydrogenase family)